jgi:hypothetical protein
MKTSDEGWWMDMITVRPWSASARRADTQKNDAAASRPAAAHHPSQQPITGMLCSEKHVLASLRVLGCCMQHAHALLL